jgi:hypothetical protein
VKQPPQQPRKQPPERPRKQRDEEEEEDIKLTDGEEEDMFVEKERDVLCEPTDDINTWFQIWDRDSKAGIGFDAANDPNTDSYDSEYFDSSRQW